MTMQRERGEYDRENIQDVATGAQGEALARMAPEAGMKIGVLGHGEILRRMGYLAMAGRSVVTESAARTGWFVLSVVTGREMDVENFLTNPDGLDIEALVPKRKGQAIRRRDRMIPAPILPVMNGYVLVHVPARSPVFMGLKGVKYVLDVVGGASRPMQVSSESVNLFKGYADAGRYDHAVIVAETYRVGQAVRIKDGPFGALAATVAHLDVARCRVIVELQLFGQATKMDLHLAQIEKV